MSFLTRLFGGGASRGHDDAPYPRMAGVSALTINSPEFYEAVRSGTTGASASVSSALKNTSVIRSVTLLSGVIARLPSPIKERMPDGSIVEAVNHPLYPIFMHRPNDWQDINKFKGLMQLWVLLHGNAYAQILRSGTRVVGLNPIHPARVMVEQGADWRLKYKVSPPKAGGETVTVDQSDILHLRGISEDGITGISPVKMAADVIAANVKANRAAERIFTNGMMVGGFLKMPAGQGVKSRISEEAFKRLQEQMEAKYSGPENAGKWPILEDGLEAQFANSTAVDAQLVEYTSALVEDIGRVFGVPRPLLGVDDTSWGSGVEQLAILFVRFTLAAIFDAWEQAVKFSLIPQREWGRFFLDFDERELLRGTVKEQFEAYARAAGAGGHMPWMEPNEIRNEVGLGVHPDGNGLKRAGEVKKNEQDQIA